MCLVSNLILTAYVSLFGCIMPIVRDIQPWHWFNWPCGLAVSTATEEYQRTILQKQWRLLIDYCLCFLAPFSSRCVESNFSKFFIICLISANASFLKKIYIYIYIDVIGTVVKPLLFNVALNLVWILICSFKWKLLNDSFLCCTR